MKAMVLAAGSASGLYPLTYTLPVALIPVLGKPAIERQLDWLGRCGVDEVVVNLHYLHRAVSGALADRLEKDGPIVHLKVEAELSGTAGGVALAREHFQETFCVVPVDCVTDLDLRKALEFHRSRRALCTIVALPASGASRFGHMELSEEQRVLRFVEKPRQPDQRLDWISTGIYVLEPEIFELIPDVRPFDFGQHLFPDLVGPDSGVYAFAAEGVYWQDFCDPLAYREVHRDLLREGDIAHLPEPNERGLWEGEGCVISAAAELIPPLLLGRNVVVEAGARLEGPVVLGDHVVVGENAVVSDSVLWSRTVVDPGARVTSSLVGSSCHLHADGDYDGVLLASGARFEKKVISSD